MAKIRVVLFLIILFGTSFASAEPAAASETYWDWLGVGPIYSYGPFFTTQPYYPYYYPAYSYTPSYSSWPVYVDSYWYNPWPSAQPYYYYPTNPWWIGTHGDLPKTLDIARSSSSVRVYSNGIWRTP
jgi:hypothetical protein